MSEIQNLISETTKADIMNSLWKNKLYFGDNLDILRDKIPDNSVDLIYLDPPFKSGKTYNIIFQPSAGKMKGATAQIQTFKDTWQWGIEAERNYQGLIKGSITMVRDLKGTMKSQSADIGILITFKEPTQGMIEEATKEGFFVCFQREIPRIQFLTVEDLFKTSIPVKIPAAYLPAFKKPFISKKPRNLFDEFDKEG